MRGFIPRLRPLLDRLRGAGYYPSDELTRQVLETVGERRTQMRNFSPARKRVDVSPGESVRIIRELQGLSQVQLAELCGIPQTTISSIENSRVNLGVERAKVLALALRCHPAVLVFPGWQVSPAPAA